MTTARKGRTRVTFKDAALLRSLRLLPGRAARGFSAVTGQPVRQVLASAQRSWPVRTGISAAGLRAVEEPGLVAVVNSVPYAKEVRFSQKPGKAPPGRGGQLAYKVLITDPLERGSAGILRKIQANFAKLAKE